MKIDRKKVLFILIVFVIIGSIFLIKDYFYRQTQLQHQKRYEEIRNDVDREMQKYIYLTSPKCTKGSATHITHKELVYNRGMDKEKFLDVDGKSYCKVYVDSVCVEDGKWEWKVYLSCKDYEDKGYKDWDQEFAPKN